MTKKNDPYVGKTVKINRLGKTVMAYLQESGNAAHYKGVWLNEDGIPKTGIVPVAEVKKILGDL